MFGQPMGEYSYDYLCHVLAEKYGWTLEYIDHMPRHRFERQLGIIFGLNKAQEEKRKTGQ